MICLSLGYQTKVVSTVYAVEQGVEGFMPALNRICEEAAQAVTDGYTIVILSDRMMNKDYVPIR